jgi:asparagine synthase (glutamine-hydrolysing)
LGITLPKIADLLAAGSQREAYDKLTVSWQAKDAVPGAGPIATLLSLVDDVPFRSSVRAMMCRDLLSYHCDDILTKVDRASMAVGLEARVPLVDHRVIALAATLPDNMLIRQGQGKWILRQILKKHVPDFKLATAKRGFSVPLAQWLRGPLRDWAEGLLAPERVRREGYLDGNLVLRVWQEHQSGRKDWAYPLWHVLMFQAFLTKHHAGDYRPAVTGPQRQGASA